jgi:hypothetical protein
MWNLRAPGPLSFAALLIVWIGPPGHAQTRNLQPPTNFKPAQFTSPQPVSPSTGSTDLPATGLPEAPGSHIPAQQATEQANAGSILGTVQDANGAEIANALVTLENEDTRVGRTLMSDSAGFFRFDTVEPGRFSLTVTSSGFAKWVSTDLTLENGQCYDVPSVELSIASAMSVVEVTVTPHEIAEDQMHFAEKQRVLGIFPNFYASYIWHAAPMSAGQKFRLALRSSTDPVTIAIPAVVAGVEQSQNSYDGFGPGAQGFAKRFGASSADSIISTMVSDAILPTIFRQDPRYFYKGTGSIASRALYAIATVVICRGDNGRWQPNYSNVLGNLASAGISNTYYPSSDRNGVRLTIDNWLIGDASGALSSLFQEFLVKKISRGVQPQTFSEPGTK